MNYSKIMDIIINIIDNNNNSNIDETFSYIYNNLVKNNIQCDKTMTKGLNNVQIANYLIGCFVIDYL